MDFKFIHVMSAYTLNVCGGGKVQQILYYAYGEIPTVAYIGGSNSVYRKAACVKLPEVGELRAGYQLAFEVKPTTL